MHDATRLRRATHGTGAVAVSLIALCAMPGIAAEYTAQVVNPDLGGGALLPDGRTMLVWGTDGTILRSEDGAKWRHTESASVADLARVAFDTKGSLLVAVGAQGAILRSIDGGRSWQAAKNDTTDTDLRAVAWHAPTGTWIAAGTGGRILRSTDGARTWASVPTGLTLSFHALFVDPRTNAVLIGGDEGAVGISHDAGQSWSVTRISMPAPVSPVTGFFRHDGMLLATSALGRFLTSGDDAKSWDLLQTSTTAMFIDSAADPVHGSIVMTGHDGTVLRTADGGKNWNGIELTVEGRAHYLSSVYFDAARKLLLIVGHNGTIARSDSGGAGWISWSIGTLELRGLIADPGRDRLVVYGTGGLLMTSTDGGGSWRSSAPSLDVSLRDIAPAPRGNALIAAGKLGAVVRSTDGGASWSRIEPDWPDPNTPPDLRMLIEAPARDALVGVGPPGTIVRSSPDGSAWSVRHWTPIEAERAFTWIVAEPRRSRLTAIEVRGQMQVSTDDGNTWNPADAPTQGTQWAFWHGALTDAGVMIVAGKSGTAARSRDGGLTWSEIRTGTNKDLFGSYADGDLLFLVGQDGTLLRSADAGLSWTATRSGTGRELRRMLRAPGNRALIAFGAYGSIVRSEDRGLTWKPVASGTDGELRKGIVAARTGELFIAGSRGAILRSRDEGRTWQVLPSHTKRHLSSLVIDSGGGLVAVGDRIVRLVRELRR